MPFDPSRNNGGGGFNNQYGGYPHYPQANPPAKKGKSAMPIVIISVVLVGFLVVGGVVAFSLINKSSNGSANKPESLVPVQEKTEIEIFDVN